MHELPRTKTGEIAVGMKRVKSLDDPDTWVWEATAICPRCLTRLTPDQIRILMVKEGRQ